MTDTALPVELSTTTLATSISRLVQHTAEAFAPMVQALRRVGTALADFTRTMAERANDPVHVAGLQARYYTRAAMDPAYATPEGLHALVCGILDLDSEVAEGLWLMSRANRCLVAAAAMTGWETRGGSTTQTVAHRQWGTTRVEVRCG